MRKEKKYNIHGCAQVFVAQIFAQAVDVPQCSNVFHLFTYVIGKNPI